MQPLFQPKVFETFFGHTFYTLAQVFLGTVFYPYSSSINPVQKMWKISGGSGDLQWTSDSNTDPIGQRSQDKLQQWCSTRFTKSKNEN